MFHEIGEKQDLLLDGMVLSHSPRGYPTQYAHTNTLMHLIPYFNDL